MISRLKLAVSGNMPQKKCRSKNVAEKRPQEKCNGKNQKHQNVSFLLLFPVLNQF